MSGKIPVPGLFLDTTNHIITSRTILQDEVAGAPGVFGDISENETERRKRSVRATLEKKVAILDRAVENNPSCVELKLERLRLCRELWEPAALLKEWKKLVFLHPNSAPLWRKYLLFMQSHFSTFSVSKVNTVYGKCLSTLAAVQDGSMVSHQVLPGTDEHMLGNGPSHIIYTLYIIMFV